MRKIYFIIILATLTSCSGNEDPEPLNNFDRSKLLINIYDNIIIPAHVDFDANVHLLRDDIINLISNSSEDNLNNARNSWVKTFNSWQNIDMFDMYAAYSQNYWQSTDSYPCMSDEIDELINDGASSIPSINQYNQGIRGLPAIGYLLYGNDSLNILENFNNPNYSLYLNALIQEIKDNTDVVLNNWKYSRNTFISSTGNTDVSSLNVLTNAFLNYLERRLREAKIGTPLNIRTTFTVDPTQIESYYKPEISKTLLLSAFESIKRIYYGNSFTGNSQGIGYDDYLSSLNNTEELRMSIDNQINIIDQKINAMNNDFIIQLYQDKYVMNDAFVAIQELVIYLKLDMLSYIGISTTYADNDGDGG